MSLHVGMCMPTHVHGWVTAGFVWGACLAHGQGINLEVVFTTEIDEWITSFCLWLNIYAKHIWQTSLEIHLLVNMAAFLSASSSPCHANGLGFPYLTTRYRKSRDSSAISHCILSIPAPSHSSLPLPFVFQTKGLIVTCPFCKLTCFLRFHIFSVFNVFHIQLSYQIITWWIVSLQGGLYGGHQPLDCTRHGRRCIETCMRGCLCRAPAQPIPGRPVFTRNVCLGEITTPAPGKLFQITWDIVSWLNFWGVAQRQVVASIYTFNSSGSHLIDTKVYCVLSAAYRFPFAASFFCSEVPGVSSLACVPSPEVEGNQTTVFSALHFLVACRATISDSNYLFRP